MKIHTISQNWHTAPHDEVLEAFETDRQGLTQDEAAQRLKEYGPNILPSKPPPTLLQIFLRQFLSPLIYVLLIAAGISIAIGELTDALFIFGVLLLNAIIGTFQEWKAEQSAASLQQLLKITTRVKRDGKSVRINAELLVPGDLVVLEAGDKVPADLRLLETNNCSMEEAFLTGESLAVEKDAHQELKQETAISNRVNMGFAGATVTTGRSLGVVVGTAKDTEVGKIATTLSEMKVAKVPLVQRMERFTNRLSYLVGSAAVLLAVIALLQGMDIKEVFFIAVALAVSAIPEGLPVAITVALSISSSRMSKRNVIVRKLTAVEGLGSCTYIGSDKTGTLTVNRLTAKQIVFCDGTQFNITGQGYNAEGKVVLAEGNAPEPAQEYVLKEIARTGILCNDADLDLRHDEWEYQGDAVDIAFLSLGYKMGYDVDLLRTETRIIESIPFDPLIKYQAVFFEAQGEVVVAVKGAFEVLLNQCTKMMTPAGAVPVDPQALEQQSVDLSAQGYRVLMLAKGNLGKEEKRKYTHADLQNLTCLGIVGFIDPLRPEAKDAVDKCRKAGVDVAMITGDNPATALTIARDLGIAANDENVVTGAELEALSKDSPQFLLEKVRSTHVFARVTPLQKLDIVDSLMKSGHFCAVTGDGVNDTPALRKANIGVGMGSGTDLAKETASIIVTDDNFSSIVDGIEEGRVAYSNIRKVIYLLISTGLAEIILITMSLLFGLPLPLVAVQLLWLNLVTNGIQDVALAFEGKEPGIMKQPPRSPQEKIFNPLMIQQSVVSSAVMALVAFGTWYYLLNQGWGQMEARNLLLLLMVLFENVHVFNCRSEETSIFNVPLSRNWLLIIGVVVAQLLHIGVMHLPFMQTVLEVQPVPFQTWGLLLGMASLLLVVMEVFKVVKKRLKKR